MAVAVVAVAVGGFHVGSQPSRDSTLLVAATVAVWTDRVRRAGICTGAEEAQRNSSAAARHGGGTCRRQLGRATPFGAGSIDSQIERNTCAMVSLCHNEPL